MNPPHITALGRQSLFSICQRTAFRQISPMTTLRSLEMRQHSCVILPCPHQNYARKSAHKQVLNRLLITPCYNYLQICRKNTLLIGKSETSYKSFSVAPVLFYLDPAFQIDLDLEKVLQFDSCGCGCFFQHSSALTDNNALV